VSAKGGAKKIVIVRKKKVHGGGHHGGSWKVAYADFVTAMMAFFMVMWILGMDENLRKAIEGYFSNPVGYKKGYSAGVSPISVGTSPGKVQQPSVKLIVRNFETKRFKGVADRISHKLEGAEQLLGGRIKVEIVVTQDGLRIELIETGSGITFFSPGSAVMKPKAAIALDLIAAELGELRNPIIVEGHTDASPMNVAPGYSNWELSADRANAARRVLEAAGIPRERIVGVRGMADRDLRNRDDPTSPENRRISIFLPFSDTVREPMDTPADTLVKTAAI
jgi:chemotaxis protein MotB